MRTARLHPGLRRVAAVPADVPAALAPMPWWCAPAGITLGFLIPTICLIALASEMQMSTLTIRGVRFLDLDAILLGILMLTPIALGGWVGAQVDLARGRREIDAWAWDRTALVIGSIACLAYAVLFKSLLFNPVALIHLLTGVSQPNRAELGASAGVSSLVNMAQVFFAIAAFRLVDRDGPPLPRAVRVMLLVLTLLTLLRVYAQSERLALMEILVPFGLALGKWMSSRRSGAWKLAAALGPFGALPLVILYFGAAEYFRSWGSDTYRGKTSFWEFAIGRFVSYYVTSLNNGAGVVATTPDPTWKFEHVMEWAHRAPFGLGPEFSEYVGYNAEAKSSFVWFLRTYVDPEFNSNSGIYVPVADLGVPMALAYMLLIGVGAGLAFRAYRAQRLGGVLFFPLFFITFLEIFRYPFLGQPRATTWALGILLALALVRQLQRHRERQTAGARISNLKKKNHTHPTTAAGAGASQPSARRV
ncbi:MAG: hypothetical protein L6Q75_12895 [Burkholderiaceae bacterium]|nr:hypothetical protein [Burkholderiaceae bacterium]